MTTIAIQLSQEQLKAALQDGITAQLPMETNGATGPVRVAVQDQTTGEPGSVRVPFEAN